MTNRPAITPPPELVQQWREEDPYEGLLSRAAQWGADMELGACVSWLLLNGWGQAVDRLRAARRPKPPSLKEQGMASLNEVIECLKALAPGAAVDGPAIETIRRALEALPDD